MPFRSIFIGYDPNEAEAFAVARQSVRKHIGTKAVVHGLLLSDLQRHGLYQRETLRIDGVLYDVPSKSADYDGALSTEHANARFLVPRLVNQGWALFIDGDMLVRADLEPLFALCEANPDKALYCVQHDYVPAFDFKKSLMPQTRYACKNWSSFMLFNCEHDAHERLTPAVFNTTAGRALHQFCWLREDEIGALDPAWNWLCGHNNPNTGPNVVHWTEGGPWLPDYANVAYADEWRAARDHWVRSENAHRPIGVAGPAMAAGPTVAGSSWLREHDEAKGISDGRNDTA